MLKICYLRDFKKLPDQNSIDIPEGFICSKLKDINECASRSNMPKDGCERYVLFFKSTSNVCNHFGVARKD